MTELGCHLLRCMRAVYSREKESLAQFPAVFVADLRSLVGNTHLRGHQFFMITVAVQGLWIALLFSAGFLEGLSELVASGGRLLSLGRSWRDSLVDFFALIALYVPTMIALYVALKTRSGALAVVNIYFVFALGFLVRELL